MKPYRQTTPTHHGRRHASQPRLQDTYTYGTRPRTCHTLPATSGLTARTGMPYHNKKGIFPLAEISPYGDASAISRVLSPFTGVSIIYLRPQSPAASSNLPLDIGRATLNCRYTWSCNPQGVQPDDIAASAVGSYPAFSPLPAADARGAAAGGYFLLRYYTLTDVEPLTRAALCVARTFLPPPKRTAIERACIFYLYLL